MRPRDTDTVFRPVLPAITPFLSIYVPVRAARATPIPFALRSRNLQAPDQHHTPHTHKSIAPPATGFPSGRSGLDRHDKTAPGRPHYRADRFRISAPCFPLAPSYQGMNRRSSLASRRSQRGSEGIVLRHTIFTRCASRTTLHEIVLLLDLELGLVQPGVDPAPFHKGVMVSLFNNRPPLHDNDTIHIVERRQAVRDDERRSSLGQLI